MIWPRLHTRDHWQRNHNFKSGVKFTVLALKATVGLICPFEKGIQHTSTSCYIHILWCQHTLTATPSRVVTMNQGVTEFMLAMGLSDKMVGTAYLDDTIWPKYKDAYSGIPVLSSSYPDEATLMNAKPDFILGSYASAFRERTCTDKCRGIFSNATIGPCNGPGSDHFESGSNTHSQVQHLSALACRCGIGTCLNQCRVRIAH